LYFHSLRIQNLDLNIKTDFKLPSLIKEGVWGGNFKLPPRPLGTPPWQGGDKNALMSI